MSIRRFITVPVETAIDVDVDVDVVEILEDITESELADFGLFRIASNEGQLQIFEAVKDFHTEHHTGLVRGCTQDICRELRWEASGIIQDAGTRP